MRVDGVQTGSHNVTQSVEIYSNLSIRRQNAQIFQPKLTGNIEQLTSFFYLNIIGRVPVRKQLYSRVTFWGKGGGEQKPLIGS